LITEAATPLVRAFVAQVHPDRYDEYRRLHAQPWPKMLALLKAANLTDYYIHFDESRHLLFARWTYVGSDLDGDLRRLRADIVAQKWDAQTLACMIPIGDGSNAWAPLVEIFELG
jgi:L-rhamnose mutarotase